MVLLRAFSLILHFIAFTNSLFLLQILRQLCKVYEYTPPSPPMCFCHFLKGKLILAFLDALILSNGVCSVRKKLTSKVRVNAFH